MNKDSKSEFYTAQLKIFNGRCRTLADRVRSGNLGFLDAVDMAASAAEWSGLAECAGWDACQSVMSLAFMGVPRQEGA